MSYEIERKFLLSGLPAGLEANPARRIEQGYLAVEDVEVRLRRIDGDTVHDPGHGRQADPRERRDVLHRGTHRDRHV